MSVFENMFWCGGWFEELSKDAADRVRLKSIEGSLIARAIARQSSGEGLNLPYAPAPWCLEGLLKSKWDSDQVY